MPMDYPRASDLLEIPRANAIQSTAASLLGLYLSDWIFLLTGVGIAAAILLIA